MDRREYLIASIKNKWCYDKRWFLRCYSVKSLDNPELCNIVKDEIVAEDVKVDDYGIPSFCADGKVRIVIKGEEGPVVEVVAGWKSGTPLFRWTERMDFEPGDLNCIKKKINATLGTFTVNGFVIENVLSAKVDFENSNWFRDGYLKVIANRVVNEDLFTPEEAHDFVDSLNFLADNAILATPTGSDKSVATDPAVKKYIREAFSDKEAIKDPAYLSKVEVEASRRDKEYLKGDPSEIYYRDSKKSYQISRKRMLVSYGAETNFLDQSKYDVIPASLEDGVSLDDAYTFNNSIREGSYSRGAATAIAGEYVKVIGRAWQNTRFVDTDCKTTVYGVTMVLKHTAHLYVGMNLVTGPGKYENITAAKAESLVGKTIKYRTVRTCKQAAPDFCKACVGDKHYHDTHLGPGQSMTVMSSRMMDMAMQKAHAKALKTATFNFEDFHS